MPGVATTTLTAAGDWIVVLPVVLSLFGAALLLMLRGVPAARPVFAMVIVAAVALCDAQLFFRVLYEGPLTMTMGSWLPPFGISFSADTMGAGFALTAALVALVILIYARSESVLSEPGGNFHVLVLVLLGGVSGVFLTGDLFNLYVWFEVLLVASFGLMVFGGEARQIDGAVKYGFINFLSTTIFLAALGLLYGLLGTLNMADIVGVAPAANPAAMTAIAALLLLAFGLKAAAFPVNAWLPASYHTPPAAISALFAGLLTKVGVYALLRALILLLPASRDLLDPVITVIVVATLLIAPLGAIAETNLRRSLGFLVIGGIGMAMAALSLPSATGVAGSVIYVFHSILTMTGLYLVAGLIEKVTGHTDTRAMGGLYAAQPLLAALFLLLILSAAGLPPFLGFWPKLLLVEAGLDGAGLTGGAATNFWDLAVLVAIVLNAVLTLIAGTRLWSHIFWRPGPEGDRSELTASDLRTLRPHEAWTGAMPVVVLTALIVVAGLWPDLLLKGAAQAAAGLLDPARYVASVGLGGAP